MSDTAKIELLRGSEHPYDGKDNHTDSDWATIAALGVLHNLNDRRGIKWELAKVDPDVRAEIVETMSDIIRAAYELESLDRIAAFHDQVKSINKEKWQELSLDLWQSKLTESYRAAEENMSEPEWRKLHTNQWPGDQESE